MSMDPLLESDEANDPLVGLCEPDKLKPDVARALVAAVRGQKRPARRRGLFDQFDTLLADDR